MKCIRAIFTNLLKYSDGGKVLKMTSYLLLITLFTNGIQELQHQWKKCVDYQRDYVKK